MKKTIIVLICLIVFSCSKDTDLFDYIESNDLTKIEKHIERGKSLIIEDDSGLTPMIYAVKKKNPEIVKLLVDNGADINKRNPLCYAIKKGYEEIAAILIEKGADLDNKDAEGFTLVENAIKWKQHNVLDILLSHKPDLTNRTVDNLTLLEHSIHYSNYYSAELLLKAGADNYSPLVYAVVYNDIFLLKNQLSSFPDIDHKNNDGWTPLMFAARKQSYDAAKILLGLGADLNIKNNDNMTAINLTTSEQIKNLLKSYGARGAKVSKVVNDSTSELLALALPINEDGMNELMKLAYSNSYGTLKDKITDSVSLNKKDYRGKNILMWLMAPSEMGAGAYAEEIIEIVEILFQYNSFDLNSQDIYGNTLYDFLDKDSGIVGNKESIIDYIESYRDKIISAKESLVELNPDSTKFIDVENIPPSLLEPLKPEPLGMGGGPPYIPSGDAPEIGYDDCHNIMTIINVNKPAKTLFVEAIAPDGRRFNKKIKNSELQFHDYDDWNNRELKTPAISFSFNIGIGFVPGVWEFNIFIDDSLTPVSLNTDVRANGISIGFRGERSPFDLSSSDKLSFGDILWFIGSDLEPNKTYTVGIYHEEDDNLDPYGAANISTDDKGRFEVELKIGNDLPAGAFKFAFGIEQLQCDLFSPVFFIK